MTVNDALRRGWLLALYFVAAAAGFSGYFAKWAFGDGQPYLSLAGALEGTSFRPYVYRQLVPAIANAVGPLIGVVCRQLGESDKHLNRIFARASDSALTAYECRYLAAYALCFLALFASLWVLRAVCQRVIGVGPGATAAPVVFALFLPLIMTQGGHYYDMPELFFLSAAVWLCVAGRAAWLPLVVLLGTYNKESFLIFVPLLYPLLRARYAQRPAALIVAGNTLLSVATYAYLRQRYAGNPGDTTFNQLTDNLHYYFNPASYFKFELSYGVIAPKGLSLIAIALVGSLVHAGWSRLPRMMREHLLLGALISAPLMLLFCKGGELRNLSLTFVGFVCLLCVTIDTELSRAAARRVTAGEP